jgi:hypothetical protein
MCDGCGEIEASLTVSNMLNGDTQFFCTMCFLDFAQAVAAAVLPEMESLRSSQAAADEPEVHKLSPKQKNVTAPPDTLSDQGLTRDEEGFIEPVVKPRGRPKSKAASNGNQEATVAAPAAGTDQ